MTADHGSEAGRQRTVAELLEQYGGDGRSGGGRRRRRAADSDQPAEASAPDANDLAEPGPDYRTGYGTDHGTDHSTDYGTDYSPGYSDFGSDYSNERPPARWDGIDPPTRPPTRSALDEPGGTGSLRTGSFGSAPDPRESRDGVSGPGGFDVDDWSRPSYRLGTPLSAPDPLTGPGPFTGTGAFPSGSPSSSGQSYRASIYRGESFNSVQREESTEQLPRYRDHPEERIQLTGPITGPIGGTPPRVLGTDRLQPVGGRPGGPGATDDDSGPSTEIASRAALFTEDEVDEDVEDHTDEPDRRDATDRRDADGRADRDAEDRDAEDRDAEDRDAEDRDAEDRDQAPPKASRRSRAAAARDVPAGLDDEDEIDEEPSRFRAYALLVVQGVLGAVGGAALWIGFSYLWRNLPVVALVAAVAATSGLVLVVRTIRGADDLRTTMLAVLVGLVVTISPVALMIATWVR